MSRLTPNFRSAIIFYNTINYNPKFCDMQEENIKFCLLHEEGHKIKPQYGPPSLFAVLLLFLIPLALIMIFYYTYPVFVLACFIYSIIFLMIALAMLRQSFHDDEFDSDLFAAEILRDYYGIKKPSYIAYNTFKEIQQIICPKYSEKISIFEKLEVSLFNIHPLNEDRVKKIALLVDCY